MWRRNFSQQGPVQRLLDAVSNDGVAAEPDVNRNGRSQTSALHDLASDPDTAAERANLHGIVNRAVTGIGHHGMASAISILFCQPRQVRYEFQFAPPVRFLEREGPEASTGKPNHDGVQMFVSERLYKVEFFRCSGLGEFFGGRCHCRALGSRCCRNWRWRRRGGLGGFRGRRFGGRGFRCPPRRTLYPPKDCNPNHKRRNRYSADLGETFWVCAARASRGAQVRIGHARDLRHIRMEWVKFV
jgi:hypothetical protein